MGTEADQSFLSLGQLAVCFPQSHFSTFPVAISALPSFSYLRWGYRERKGGYFDYRFTFGLLRRGDLKRKSVLRLLCSTNTFVATDSDHSHSHESSPVNTPQLEQTVAYCLIIVCFLFSSQSIGKKVFIIICSCLFKCGLNIKRLYSPLNGSQWLFYTQTDTCVRVLYIF